MRNDSVLESLLKRHDNVITNPFIITVFKKYMPEIVIEGHRPTAILGEETWRKDMPFKDMVDVAANVFKPDMYTFRKVKDQNVAIFYSKEERV